eukprot:5164516-Amphidinium_carterae.1
MGWAWPVFMAISTMPLKLLCDRIALANWPFPTFQTSSAFPLDAVGGFLKSDEILCSNWDNITCFGINLDKVKHMRNRVLRPFEEVCRCMELAVLRLRLRVAAAGQALCGPKGFVGHGFGSREAGHQLEVFVGHFIAASLFNRAGLAVWRAVYVFMKRHYLTSVKLWSSVVHEINIVAENVLFLFSEFLRP